MLKIAGWICFLVGLLFSPVREKLVLVISLIVGSGALAVASGYLIGDITFRKAFEINIAATTVALLLTVGYRAAVWPGGLLGIIVAAIVGITTMLWVYARYLETSLVRAAAVLTVTWAIGTVCFFAIGMLSRR